MHAGRYAGPAAALLPDREPRDDDEPVMPEVPELKALEVRTA